MADNIIWYDRIRVVALFCNYVQSEFRHKNIRKLWNSSAIGLDTDRIAHS